MQSLISWVLEGAAAAGDGTKTAVRSPQNEITYDALILGAATIAADLEDAGIGRGDRVGIWMAKTPRTVQMLLGVMWAGAAYVPLDPRAPWKRSRKIVQDCALSGLVADVPRLEHLSALLDGHSLKRLLLDAPDRDSVEERYASHRDQPWELVGRVLDGGS